MGALYSTVSGLLAVDTYTCSLYVIEASLSEPLSVELAGALLWYIYMYIYLYPWAVHLVPRGPPVNAQRANVRPAE